MGRRRFRPGRARFSSPTYPAVSEQGTLYALTRQRSEEAETGFVATVPWDPGERQVSGHELVLPPVWCAAADERCV